MWANYSTRDTSEVVGLSESSIRACVREGLLDVSPESVPLRFSFQDLKVLKTVKSLTREGVSLRRAKRQLRALRKRLADPGSLASVVIDAHNGHVVVRDGEQAWRADTGQLVFGFQFQDPDGELASFPERGGALEPIAAMTADEWFERALSSEESDPAQAIRSYEQVLRQRPACTESLINLGRLHAEAGELDQAELCFRRALEIEPSESTALYNLGVLAQDLGRDREAIAYYERALDLEDGLAEAHYNLATIFDRSGNAREAIRHINEYRKLTKRR